MSDIYPTRAYDILSDIEREAVDSYVAYVVEHQRAKRQRIAAALNLPIPDDYIRRSREVLARPVVRSAVAERIIEEAQAYDISPDRVIAEHAIIAFSDITDFLRDGYMGQPTIVDIKDLPVGKTGAIKSIECKQGMTGTSWKVTLHDKLPALKALCEMMGMTAPDRPVVLRDYVREEVKNLSKQEETAPEAEYTELLEYVNKEGSK